VFWRVEQANEMKLVLCVMLDRVERERKTPTTTCYTTTLKGKQKGRVELKDPQSGGK